MSSSKIFKQDLDFTPTTLVRHDLTEHIPDAEEGMVEKPVADETELEIEQAAEVPDKPDPVDEQPQQPEIDIQAIQEEAYAQGVHDAKAQFDAEIRPAVEAFLTACQKIDSQRSMLMEQYKGDIINTIIAVGEKVIRDELQTKRDVIVSTLEKALNQAITSDELTVTLNPEDLQIIEEKKEGLISAVRGLENLVIKTDPQISRGGCLLESNTCFIDATIESQLKRMEEFLEEHTTVSEIEPDQVQE